jgi:hypothetical protein
MSAFTLYEDGTLNTTLGIGEVVIGTGILPGDQGCMGFYQPKEKGTPGEVADNDRLGALVHTLTFTSLAAVDAAITDLQRIRRLMESRAEQNLEKS